MQPMVERYEKNGVLLLHEKFLMFGEKIIIIKFIDDLMLQHILNFFIEVINIKIDLLEFDLKFLQFLETEKSLIIELC
jgi:hypothetical protein